VPRRRGNGGGDVGTPRPNRADLRRPVPDQPYGRAAEQARSLAMNPRAAADRNVPPPVPLAQGTMTASSRPPMEPGSLPFMDETLRPNEPVTHGAARGPGAGPEVLGQQRQPMRLSEELHHLASGPDGNPVLAALAQNAERMNL